MTTLNANPQGTLGTNSGDGSVGPNGTYSTITAATTAAGLVGAYQAGQQLASTLYTAWETWIEFDTSSLGATAVITAESLQVNVTADNSATDFTFQARTYDYGGTIDTADWRTPTQLTALTLLATLATSTITTVPANYTLTENGTNLRAAINKTGSTRMIFCSDRWASATAPTQTESINLSTTAANTVLSVTYTYPPNSPTGLTATPASSTQINLSWTAPATDATHDAATSYNVDRAPDASGAPGVFANIATGVGTTTYNDTGPLTPSTTYWYRVSAVNAAGTSTPSGNASATTNPALGFQRPPRLQGSSNAVRRAATR